MMAKYRFDQIAINSTEKKKPVEEDRFTYLGLEHLDSGSLKVTRFGTDVAPIGEKLVMRKGDVLFGKRRAYQKKVAIAPFDGIFSAHGMVLRPKEEVVDKGFFPLFISSDYFLDAAIKISVGSLSPTINWRDLKELEFELPDLETQRHLAAVLWAMNETIDAYKALISATGELVKSQFIEMFGDKDFPKLLDKCLAYFPGVDRDDSGWESLMAAQECIPNNKAKDAFGADYRVVNRAYNALSPDPFLDPYIKDYRWLSKVYESVKPVDNRGRLIWASVGAKTMELVHENIEVRDVAETDPRDILELDAQLIEDFIAGNEDAKKRAKKIEIDLVARIRSHDKDRRFIRLGERLEELREKHEQGLITSIEFLKHLLELAREAAHAEKEVVPEEEIDRGKAALTELFNGVKTSKTPVIVERIVKDIDDIVRIVRFDGWQDTTTGRKTVKKEVRAVISVRYGIKDKDVFKKAYSYIEQYY